MEKHTLINFLFTFQLTIRVDVISEEEIQLANRDVDMVRVDAQTGV